MINWFTKLFIPKTCIVGTCSYCFIKSVASLIESKDIGATGLPSRVFQGDNEPLVLCYAVFKAPELNNPLDPSSGETGNTLYGITEIYNGPEGAQAHMALGQQREKMFSDLIDLTNQYCVAGILGSPVVRAMR